MAPVTPPPGDRPARSRIVLGSPLPTTPPTRSGSLHLDLLAQFGSQNSQSSVTKARKMAPPPQSKPVQAEAATDSSKRQLRQSKAPPSYSIPSPSSDTPSASSDSAQSALLSPATQGQSQAELATADDTSEDELAPMARHSGRILQNKKQEKEESLKMEKRKREQARAEGVRRSTRQRNTILESDTIFDSPRQRTARMKQPPKPKIDTTRTRLRDDIDKTKAKADAFLLAHEDYFLPLLPQNNYITKLHAKLKGAHVEAAPYEELQEQPQGVTATMKPYQLSGLAFLTHLHRNGMSGILGDEMGLGKTLQTLSLFQYLEEQDCKSGKQSEELRPYLVVCPLSVLNSWVSEAQKWVPGLKVMAFHGSVNERNRLKKVATGVEDQYGHDTTFAKTRKASRRVGDKPSKLPTANNGTDSYKIIVTTYETFQAEQSWFKHSFIWRYVVLDEGHKIKNSEAQFSASLKSVSAEYRLILTGTPLQNNLVELWSLLYWLYPEVFNQSTRTLFKESFDLARGQVNRQTMDHARRLLELIMLRRMKDSPDVNLGLPPKEEVLLYVPLTPMQRFWYTRLLTKVSNSLLDDLFADVQAKEKRAIQKEKADEDMWAQVASLDKATGAGEDGGKWEETAAIMQRALEQEQSDSNITSAWRSLMNLVMQLRKCCSHPYLLPGASPEPYFLGQHVIRASGKFILLEKLLRHTVFDEGKKVLLFSGFSNTLSYCEDLLAIIGIKYLRLDGGTARARRNLDIRMFNDAKSEYKAMLLSTRAGGLGINLTSAETVIFLDEDWNPQITLQAEARAHRIGQTKKVTIYKLCTQGTVEEQMMGRIRKKLYLSAKITESMKNIHGAKTKKKADRGSVTGTEDMPQLDTTQLKSLVRRGAQTLSHPEINVTEMLSWNLDTMLQKCRDQPTDPQANPDAATSDVDEDKWLSAMERVECAVFDGKRYQRQLETEAAKAAANILPNEISRADRRKGKNTTVNIGGYAINKESLNCADWEAVPTMAGKDPRLADVKREKRPEINHEDHCIVCYGADDLITCKSCPRSYHVYCLDPHFQAKVKSWNGFFCPQHECFDCLKKTSDAGGLIYRCRWCQKGYCEDCLQWDTTELIGENLPEFEMLGEQQMSGAYFVKCHDCVDQMASNKMVKREIQAMEKAYAERYSVHLDQQAVERKRWEKEMKANAKAEARALLPGAHPNQALNMLGGRYIPEDDEFEDDVDIDSPPAMTDATSVLTSGLSTPRPVTITPGLSKAKKLKTAKKRTLSEANRGRNDTEEASFDKPRNNQFVSDQEHDQLAWEEEKDSLLAAPGSRTSAATPKSKRSKVGAKALAHHP